MPKVNKVSFDRFEVRPSLRKERSRDVLVDGGEVPDPVPMAPPIGYIKQPSITDRIRDMVRSEHLRLAALQAGAETFEEADDFEVGEDYDPTSPYEEVFDPVDSDARMRLRQDDYRATVEARLNEIRPPKPESDNGSKGPDQGRSVDRSGSFRDADKVGESYSSPKQDADDVGSVSKADRGAGRDKK